MIDSDRLFVPGVGDGQGGLACCDSWGCEESDTTERLNSWGGETPLRPQETKKNAQNRGIHGLNQA